MGMTFSERLRIAMEMRGVSAAELARRINVSRAAVSQLLSGASKGPRPENLIHIARALRVSPVWLATGEGIMDEDVPLRTIPVISFVRAGDWSDVVDAYPAGAGEDYIQTHIKLGPYAFALRIEGDSMEPEFREGDIVVIDPDVPPRPGDYVVAKLDEEEKATFKKLRIRPGDVYELVPLNPDYPTLTIDKDHPGRIIGVMVEHRRFRRR